MDIRFGLFIILWNKLISTTGTVLGGKMPALKERALWKVRGSMRITSIA